MDNDGLIRSSLNFDGRISRWIQAQISYIATNTYVKLIYNGGTCIISVQTLHKR